MKRILMLIYLICCSVWVQAQTTVQNTPTPDSSANKRIVEAACGECKFGMKGTGCTLAVRIEGKPYLVEGAQPLDSYGDAHAADGMCTTIRQAKVSGAVKGKKFVVTSFTLLPAAKKKD